MYASQAVRMPNARSPYSSRERVACSILTTTLYPTNLVLPELVQQQLVSTTSFCYIHGRSLEYYFMVMVMVIYSALL